LEDRTGIHLFIKIKESISKKGIENTLWNYMKDTMLYKN
jgi:hypothetical protein